MHYTVTSAPGEPMARAPESTEACSLFDVVGFDVMEKRARTVLFYLAVCVVAGLVYGLRYWSQEPVLIEGPRVINMIRGSLPPGEAFERILVMEESLGRELSESEFQTTMNRLVGEG